MDFPKGTVTMSLAEGERKALISRIEAGEKFDNIVSNKPIKRRFGNPVAKESVAWMLFNGNFYLFSDVVRNKDKGKEGRIASLSPLLVLSSHAVSRTFSRKHTIKLDNLLEEFRPMALALASSAFWREILQKMDRLRLDEETFCLRTPNGVAFCHIQGLEAPVATKNDAGLNVVIQATKHIFVRTWCSNERLQDDTAHKKKVYDWAHATKQKD